jgi:hypothetical protein
MKMAYTLDSKVGDLLNDPKAKDIVEKYAPSLANNPMVSMAKGMSLRSVLDMPQAKQAGITEDKVQKVLSEINAKEK